MLAITRQIFSSITSKETKLIFGVQILKNKSKQIFSCLEKKEVRVCRFLKFRFFKMDAKDGEESDEVNKTMLNEQSKYKTDPKNQVIQFINCFNIVKSKYNVCM